MTRTLFFSISEASLPPSLPAGLAGSTASFLDEVNSIDRLDEGEEGGRERQTRHTRTSWHGRELSRSPSLSRLLRSTSFRGGHSTPHGDVVHAACRAAPRQDLPYFVAFPIEIN